ncbi:MAG: hypothetical protein NW203_06975 [Hyphomonadaceae bacterium]|nr:hypothetical protein [Hyphomonadaceae bacterium]
MTCAVHTVTLPKGQGVSVNGVAIAREAIAAEAQHHPAPTLAEALKAAARALVVRELLVQEARRLGIDAVPHEEDGRRELAEEAMVRALIEREALSLEGDDIARRDHRRAIADYVARLAAKAEIIGIELAPGEPTPGARPPRTELPQPQPRPQPRPGTGDGLLAGLLRRFDDEAAAAETLLALGDLGLSLRVRAAAEREGVSEGKFATASLRRYAAAAGDEEWVTLLGQMGKSADPGSVFLRRGLAWATIA